MMCRTVALVVAAGRGERAGGTVPKQFAMLAGVPVIARAVAAFGEIPVFVVIADGQQAALAQALPGQAVAGVIIGGATRQQSVRNGLAAILAGGGSDHVLIHDAARPLLPRRVLDALLIALETCDAAVPVLPVADSLARGHAPLGEAVARDMLWRVQTPQAFRMPALLAALAAWTGPDATDEAQVVRAGGFTVATIAGDVMLDKITQPDDLARVASLLAPCMVSRSAMGFDVHQLQPGQALWLGGIRIEHSHGLAGHSDADVALHAITDALLGTIGEGDIGMHFPPSDPQWRGVRSDQFLAHARDLVTARGGIVDFVDLTIICEAPKIGPYRALMRTTIAAILKLPPTRISIKATTTERLGFTGRGEGIAAQAIATVRLPEDL